MVIFITNRECQLREGSRASCPQESDTIDNLRSIGINNVTPDELLLKNEQPSWGSEKKSRRELIAEHYRVLMLFGDDLGAFLPNGKKNISAEQRNELVTKYQENWCNKWFMFSNPTYGSWQEALDGPKTHHLNGYE
jgi:acid phosphatase